MTAEYEDEVRYNVTAIRPNAMSSSRTAGEKCHFGAATMIRRSSGRGSSVRFTSSRMRS